MKKNGIGLAIAMCSVFLVGTHAANAADITVLAVGALRSALEVVIPEFENASGDKVKVEAGAAGAMVARIEKGEADLSEFSSGNRFPKNTVPLASISFSQVLQISSTESLRSSFEPFLFFAFK